MPSDRTQRRQVKDVLRRYVWLISKERATAMKKAHYACENCGVHKSVAKGKEQKLDVHHKRGITIWDKVIDLILENILCDPRDLEVLCPDCHAEK